MMANDKKPSGDSKKLKSGSNSKSKKEKGSVYTKDEGDTNKSKKKSAQKEKKGTSSTKQKSPDKSSGNLLTIIKGKYNCFTSSLHKKIESDKRYRIGSKILTYVLFLVGLYLLFYPIVPGLIYKLFYKGKEIYPYETVLEEQVSEEENARLGKKEIPQENRLVIPAINVDMPIVEGPDENALNLGVWHRPGTGTPGQGNMVLTGHRVGYAFLPDDVKNSTSFYNLDQLEGGDFIIIYWGGTEYDYEVTGSEIVSKNATYIESQDTDERLTLYTCHPVGQNAQRLVYYATRIEKSI